MSPFSVVVSFVSPTAVVAAAAIAWGKLNGRLAEREKQELENRRLRDMHEKERHRAEQQTFRDLRAELRELHALHSEAFAQLSALESQLRSIERRVA